MPRSDSTIDDLFRRGLALHNNGETARARALYDRILARNPRHADAINLRGLCDLEEGHLAPALTAFDAAIGLTPDNPFLHANRSETLERLGQSAEALAAQETACRLAPDHPGIQARFARLLRAIGRDADALIAYRTALAAAPDDVALAYELAGYLYRLDFKPQAILALRHVVAIAPGRVDGRMMLADLLTTTDEPAKALAVLADAPASDPRLEITRASALTALLRFAEAEGVIRAALPSLPGDATALHVLGQILFKTARFAEAADVLGRARALAPTDAAIGFMLGFCYQALGNLKDAWPLFEYRFEADAKSLRNRRITEPRWDGEPIADKTLLLWSDQGVGDIFRTASLFGELRPLVGRLVVECGPKTVALLTRCFPWIDVRPNSVDRLTGLPSRRDFDCHLPMGSLPGILRPTLASFPDRPSWITADPGRVQALRDHPVFSDGRPVVGLSWRGYKPGRRDHRHYTGLAALAPLIARTDCVFVSLQYGDVADEIAAFRAETGLSVHHLPDVDVFDDLEGAAALTSLVDVMIAPNSSGADIAGALGIPILRYGSATSPILLGGPRSPWYPTATYLVVPPDQPATVLVPTLIRELSLTISALHSPQPEPAAAALADGPPTTV